MSQGDHIRSFKNIIFIDLYSFILGGYQHRFWLLLRPKYPHKLLKYIIKY